MTSKRFETNRTLSDDDHFHETGAKDSIHRKFLQFIRSQTPKLKKVRQVSPTDAGGNPETQKVYVTTMKTCSKRNAALSSVEESSRGQKFAEEKKLGFQDYETQVLSYGYKDHCLEKRIAILLKETEQLLDIASTLHSDDVYGALFWQKVQRLKGLDGVEQLRVFSYIVENIGSNTSSCGNQITPFPYEGMLKYTHPCTWLSLSFDFRKQIFHEALQWLLDLYSHNSIREGNDKNRASDAEFFFYHTW